MRRPKYAGIKWVKLFFFITGLGLFLTSAAPAQAQGAMGRNFGLGLSLGNPTSLTGKYYVSQTEAVDFHLGVFKTYDRHYYGETLFLGADYLFEAWNFEENSTVSLPFYVGPGGFLAADVDDNDGDLHCHRNGDCHLRDDEALDFAIGARLPIGFAIQFQRAPFEIYLEMAPSLAFVFYDDRHDDDAGLDFEITNFALGARFYF